MQSPEYFFRHLSPSVGFLQPYYEVGLSLLSTCATGWLELSYTLEVSSTLWEFTLPLHQVFLPPSILLEFWSCDFFCLPFWGRVGMLLNRWHAFSGRKHNLRCLYCRQTYARRRELPWSKGNRSCSTRVRRF